MTLETVSKKSAIIEEAIEPSLRDQTKKKNKKSKKKKTNYDAYSKNTIGILRTKLRNNIELTNIADNKANVLLSLNALMLTFIVPFALPYMELVSLYQLQYPLLILTFTCLTTIYLAVLVLRPGKFSGQRIQIEERSQISPFFFANFERMSKGEYLEYAQAVLKDDALVNKFLSNDFYHIGLRLSEKMKLIRKAFNIFILGLAISIFLTIFLIFINI